MPLLDWQEWKMPPCSALAATAPTDLPTPPAVMWTAARRDVWPKKGMDIYQILEDNNAYEALKACDGLIMTGPTGTNVNDVAVLLLSAASVAEN